MPLPQRNRKFSDAELLALKQKTAFILREQHGYTLNELSVLLGGANTSTAQKWVKAGKAKCKVSSGETPQSSGDNYQYYCGIQRECL